MQKRELIGWLTDEQQKWELLLVAIGESRMERRGVNRSRTWHMRDLIAHLTLWQRWLITRMRAAITADAAPVPPWPAELTTDDDINAWIFAHARDLTLAEVLAGMRATLADSLQVVHELPDEIAIETIQGKFHAVRLGSERFAAGEFFHHFHDDHAAHVRAWLERGDR